MRPHMRWRPGHRAGTPAQDSLRAPRPERLFVSTLDYPNPMWCMPLRISLDLDRLALGGVPSRTRYPAVLVIQLAHSREITLGDNTLVVASARSLPRQSLRRPAIPPVSHGVVPPAHLSSPSSAISRTRIYSLSTSRPVPQRRPHRDTRARPPFRGAWHASRQSMG